MAEAIRTLPQVLALDRRTVRQRFEQRFSVTRMAEDYIEVYGSVLKRPSLMERRAVVSRLEPKLEKEMSRRDARPSSVLVSIGVLAITLEVRFAPLLIVQPK